MSRYLLFVSKSYSLEILRPLQRAARAQGDECAWYLHEVSPALLAPDETRLTSVDEVRAFNPAAVFVPGNWVPDFFPGLKVQVFHGFGIEKKGHFRVRGFFDLYCTHGPATTVPFEALARKHGYFRVIETGWPKMDPLFGGSDDGWRERHKIDRPLVLYAPTFSPALTSEGALRETIFRLAQSPHWTWVVKFHPNMPRAVVDAWRARQGARLVVAESESLLPLLHAADVMLSDTSSVVSEFLLLDKPVVTFRAQTPAVHTVNVTDPEQLEAGIARVLQRPPDVMHAASEFIAQMHPYRDGRSSERVLSAVASVLKLPAPAKKKPLNLWRRWEVRRRMGYFGWG